ncbi:AraC family transcriptional regulator [Romboutsia sp. MSSM.1001216sp_RTP31141st1_G3_RTP31141_220114]|uniref:AraC family transcriptional regulator n=1 Tax=unclassified Romboutsia TaxID=2626894 RepID=UPI0031B59E94
MCEKKFASVEYINEHYMNDIDLKDLAQIEHYNMNYYTEWFKNNMGVSPIECLQKLRIDKKILDQNNSGNILNKC